MPLVKENKEICGRQLKNQFLIVCQCRTASLVYAKIWTYNKIIEFKLSEWWIEDSTFF